MQLVAMTTLLALVQAGQMCRFKCQPMNMDLSITVESCNRNVTVSTTVCAGQCFLEDPVYLSDHYPNRQEICNGDWFYERRNIGGCKVDVPVAHNCSCGACDGENTDCRHMFDDFQSCLP